MQGVNSVILMGRIGNEPDLRQTSGGKALCRFRMATPRLKREDGGWIEEADWHDVVLWDQPAERFHRRATKGDLCTVEGRLSSRSWTDEGGQRHWRVEVVGQRANLVYTGHRPPSPAASRPEPAREARSAAAMPEGISAEPEPREPF